MFITLPSATRTLPGLARIGRIADFVRNAPLTVGDSVGPCEDRNATGVNLTLVGLWNKNNHRFSMIIIRSKYPDIEVTTIEEEMLPTHIKFFNTFRDRRESKI